MFRIIALLLCASAAADYLVDWRVPQANDANANAWVENVVVPAGENVVLEWTDYFAFHNVFRMKDKAAYDACDFAGAVELAPSAATDSVTIEATETTTYYAWWPRRAASLSASPRTSTRMWRLPTPRPRRASSRRAAGPAQYSQASRAGRARTKYFV